MEQVYIVMWQQSIISCCCINGLLTSIFFLPRTIFLCKRRLAKKKFPVLTVEVEATKNYVLVALKIIYELLHSRERVLY